MKPIVKPLGNHAFQLFWAESLMTITFRYLIEAYNIQEPFVIQHYQGKPVSQRTFGYYDGHQYLSLRSDEVVHQAICQPIEIEDSDFIRPCAVNLFKDAAIKQTHGTFIIHPVSTDTN